MTAPLPASPGDPWVPVPLPVIEARRDTADVTTLVLDATAAPCHFAPGQFNMLYRFGLGEAAISISGDPLEPTRLVHTIRAVGALTRQLCDLEPGDVVGVRGPYGTGWPVQAADGNDILIVAGGIGLAPLRPAILHVLRERARYGRVVILYGARNPEDMLFVDELQRWRGRFDAQVEVTVDRAGADWRGPIGVVTRLIARSRFDPDDTTVMTCGPEVMMRFVVAQLEKHGVPMHNVHVSMERSMRCAVGLCGHCQWGTTLVCRDGPVYSFDKIREHFSTRGL